MCDLRLRTPLTPYPPGHYCLEGTKTADVYSLTSGPSESISVGPGPLDPIYESGVVTFNRTARPWAFYKRQLPAAGIGRTEYPPDLHTCVGRRCVRGSVDLVAEQPFPCPLGHFCHESVATDIAVPKEFQHTSTLLRGLLLPARLKNAERQRPMSCWLFLSKSNSPSSVRWASTVQVLATPETTRVLSGHVQPLQATVKLYHLPHWSHLPWMRADHSRGMPGWFRMHRAWSVGSGASLPRGLLLRRRNAYARSLRSYEPPTTSPVRLARSVLAALHTTSRLIGSHRVYSSGTNQLFGGPEGLSAPQLCTEGAFCRSGSPSAGGSAPSAIKAIIVPRFGVPN